jgi:hypothetical protein
MVQTRKCLVGKPLSDLTGFQFGSLTILKLGRSKGNGAWWICQCKCGKQKEIKASDMVQGKINSCGCEHKERIAKANTTHGKTNTKTYSMWLAMRNRCNRVNQDYSSRGITYDKRWDSFENFYLDMGEAPEGMSLDRIDVNGNYEKSNCRWATREQQANNTRANVFVEWQGKTQTIAQWAKELNMNYDKLRSRIVRYKWSLDRAFEEGNTPLPADK